MLDLGTHVHQAGGKGKEENTFLLSNITCLEEEEGRTHKRKIEEITARKRCYKQWPQKNDNTLQLFNAMPCHVFAKRILICMINSSWSPTRCALSRPQLQQVYSRQNLLWWGQPIVQSKLQHTHIDPRMQPSTEQCTHSHLVR